MPKWAGKRFRARVAVLALLLAGPAAVCLAAQTGPIPHPVAAPVPRPVSAQVPAQAPGPVPADLPRWPKDSAPAPAVVQWDSHGLRISAKNSSLRQILTEVASRIGAKLDGVGADERVFGEYGPGPAKDVLAALLEGSPYNVMLIGDQGAGTPREIVLSARSTTGGTQARGAQAQQSQNSMDEDADSGPVEDAPPPQRPPLPRPPMNPQETNPQQVNPQQVNPQPQ